MNIETLKAQLDAALRENLMIQIGICDDVSLEALDAIAGVEQAAPVVQPSLSPEERQPSLADWFEMSGLPESA